MTEPKAQASKVKMKLWLVKRNDRIGYDQYDSIVVAAWTSDEARYTHPYDRLVWSFHRGMWVYANSGLEVCDDAWAAPSTLTVEYLGYTDREISGVIHTSFNAG